MDYIYDYTFILPCLNEEKCIGTVIKEIQATIKRLNLNAEILVSDNGSTDNSIQIAKELGARVCETNIKGYGSALINGTNNALGKYSFMGDSDGSYDFTNIENFIAKLNEGYDLVCGNRFKGKIEKGAMPFSHRIGSRNLTRIANLFFWTGCKDFHCGIRAYNTEKLKNIKLESTGMEYASEMLMKAKINKLKMCETPTNLRCDLRDRPPHLKAIRDGLRHLKLILKMGFCKRRYKVNA